MLPPLTLKYLKEFTDDTGLLQHAKYFVPDRKEGYSTDDNARALVVVSKYYNMHPIESITRLARTYLSFLYYMHRSDGLFYNKLSYDRQHRWDISDESYGRAIWGCASLYSSKMPDKLRLPARELINSSLNAVNNLQAPRGMAFTIMGLYEFFFTTKEERILEIIKRLAWKLVELYDNISDKSWKWFENILTYENARLPQALFLAYDIIKERRFLEVATETFEFLCKVTIIKGIFWPIGNRGWYIRNGPRSLYDQQPVEAGSMVEAAITGFKVTGRQEYIEIARIAMEWYLGRNSIRVKLYDEESGGCYDGITPHGLNYNQGAESALSFLLARLKFEEVPLKIRQILTKPTIY